uniref:hypothetical protein n=1 Tax=uncultured Dysgonomonas sp. TaxID=206096 RepID=UPI002611ED96
MKKITFLVLGIIGMLSVANAQSVMLFDFDATNANQTWVTTWNGTWPNASITKVANPDLTGINTSANVGKYTANGGANGLVRTDTIGKATLLNFDFVTKPYFSLKVWVSKPVSISIDFENNGYYPSFKTKTQSITTTGQWVTIEFNNSDISYGSSAGNYWGYYNILGITFDADLSGGTKANDVYYIDDIQLSHTSLLATTGLSPETSTGFSIYPNPTTDYINFPKSEKVQVLDLSGKL